MSRESEGVQPTSQKIIPHLITRNSAEAIEFYTRAFGATEVHRMQAPGDTRIMHAAVKIGGADVMLCDEFHEMGGKSPETLGGSPVTIHLYVEDVDATYARAVEAGATAVMPPADMFWGDRYGKLVDPFGHHWSLATPIESVSSEDMKERMDAFFAQAPAENCT